MSQAYVCHFCGAILSENDAHEFDDRILCESCLEEQTVECDCCQDRIWRHEAEGNDTYTLCRYCYENHYTTCSECGVLIHDDDARYTDDNDEPYCQECYDKLNNEAIHNYHFKPSPIFYGEGDSLFMGVELEIDGAGESSCHAQKILQIANGKDKEARLIELKRAIREYNNREIEKRWIIKDDGIDGFTALITFPEKITTYRQAREYFMDNYYCECRPSMYDCTGQAFTWTYKLVKRRGRWYCYHSVGFDV